MITDYFGAKLAIGDQVLYVPVSATGGSSSLCLGTITKANDFGQLLGGKNHDYILYIDGDETITQPYRCVKFSDEEIVMRKLASNQ